MVTVRASLAPADRFVTRHIGPSPDETRGMLATLGYETLDAFIDAVVPEDIRLRRPLALPPGRTEREVLQALRGLAAQNQLYRSYIGMGYYHSFTPQVIQRNIVENPDRKSTRLNSSHGYISYAVFCLKKKKNNKTNIQ